MTDSEKIAALTGMVKRFLEEGDYNEAGDYVFASDAADPEELSSLAKIPSVVADALALVRQLEAGR